uniref:Uncharacterized protein n=1 Tax=Setaria italica TaxID=4555 RepID=K3Y0N0_SETIT
MMRKLEGAHITVLRKRLFSGEHCHQCHRSGHGMEGCVLLSRITFQEYELKLKPMVAGVQGASGSEIISQ